MTQDLQNTSGVTAGESGTIGQQGGSPVLVPTSTPNILTVGTGMEYSTIAAAVAAAQSGDTVEVEAGTYTNDFATITSDITLIGVGGVVNMVATEAPANLKGILTVDASATIENFSFSGAAVPDADGGNGAGIRYEGGNMVLNNDSFSNNQDGLLAFPVLGLASNTIVMNDDTFSDNGSGTGYTHNAYIGAVDSLTVTNSVFEGAVAGHELKSRALVNTIDNNLFNDGPTGTASYDIDLPNGGTDVVENNTIEKGPDAENESMIHFGGEGIPYSDSSLLVQGNYFVDDQGDATAVLNQTALSATVTGNVFDNMSSGQIVNGPGSETSNYNGSGQEFSNTTQTGVIPGSTWIYTDSEAHSINLVPGGIQAVEGGAGLLTVLAIAGHIVAIGGSGGMNYSELCPSGGNDITTAANSVNTLVLSGQDSIDSEGTDTITAGNGNITALVNGSATIDDAAETGQWTVNGSATITANNSNEFIGLGASGTLAISGTEAYLALSSNGGSASFDVTQSGAEQKASISGGSMQLVMANAEMTITTGGGTHGDDMTFYTGTANVTSNGSDVINVSSANVSVIVTAGATIYGGSGTLSVFGRSDNVGALVYAGSGLTTIAGDTGNITYYGGASTNTVDSILSNDKLIGGAGTMTINGGSRETIIGGSGGIVFNSEGGGANYVSTAAGSTNILNLTTADLIVSAGSDTITTGGAINGTISGNSTVTTTGGNVYLTFSGTDTLNASGSNIVSAVAGADLTANESAWCYVYETGATVNYAQEGASGVAQSVTFSGGNVFAHSDGNPSDWLLVQTSAGTSSSVTVGVGSVWVNSFSNDQIQAGSGNEGIVMYANGATVYGGSGTDAVYDRDGNTSDAVTVYGGSGALAYDGSGASMTFIGGSGSAVINGEGGNLYVVGGSGSINAWGGGGSTTFVGGSGSATIGIYPGGGNVTFGTGNTTVNAWGWGNAISYNFLAGEASTDIVNAFRVGIDTLNLHGVSITSETVSGGSATILLSDNSSLTLTGVTNLTHLLG